MQHYLFPSGSAFHVFAMHSRETGFYFLPSAACVLLLFFIIMAMETKHSGHLDEELSAIPSDSRFWQHAREPRNLRYRGKNMCLSSVYMGTPDDRNAIMREVARIEAEGQGFWLITLFGEKKFVQGAIQTIDLSEEHVVILERQDQS